MRTLQISEKKAMELYKNGSDELKTVLEESFGKEFFQRKITDRIKTYEDACAELGIYSLDEAKLIDFGLTKHDIAYQKLATVVKALNEGWTPDVCDSSVYRWYPWFKTNGSPSSFAFGDSNYDTGNGNGILQSRTMRHLEDQLQKSIIKYWDLKYPKWKKRLVHAPNGGKRNAIEAAKFKQMGVRAGFPDLILLIPNKFYPFCGIELKIKTGRQSESQKAYQKEFESIGAKYVVVRSLDEFIEVITDYLKEM